MSSDIEWLKNPDGSKGETWNVLAGCDHKSAGCDGCWAARMATRQVGMGNKNYRGTVKGGKWTGKIKLIPDALEKPLHWRKPRRIFVQSMGDLFHEKVPDAFLDTVFAVMCLAQWHTFMVLTKRPERMAEYLQALTFERVRVHMNANWPGNWATMANKNRSEEYKWAHLTGPPFHNVHLYTSIEDQATADERIPWLLKTPAAVRGVSLEPMIGLVDLDGYLPGDRSCLACDYVGNNSGKEERCGRCGEDFPPPTEHDEPSCGCGSDDYVSSCPRCGAFDEFGPYGSEGLWDTPAVLDHVIVGGESGRGARPMNPKWVQDVRDQCVDAGVRFFFKQWGEFCHSEQMTEQTWSDVDAGVNLAGIPAETYRVGKRAAGRVLDGRTWDEMPGQAEAKR